MKFSNNGISVLKCLEGCVKQNGRHIIYDDKNGKPIDPHKPLPRGATIGYGHLIKPGEDFSAGITEERATELLCADIADTECTVCRVISANITQNQFDALVIFAYNIGAQNFANSTVVKYINNPKYHNDKYPTMESAWRAWNKSGGCEMSGLTHRRDSELKLFHTI